jgi:hypothetical protein
MRSGSYREGFRFESSDRDFMHWISSHKLISDTSQTSLYDRTKNNIMLMESNDTPPGFVKLQLLTYLLKDDLASAAVLVNDRIYISSVLFQQITFNAFSTLKSHHCVTRHGPCANAYMGSVEHDHALCIAGIHWPELALPWIQRSFQYAWPLESVLEEILKNGYHCVPVGSKIISSGNLLEWRLSFSQAEQKLLYTMNHTQFLVYGLLKIFLKEIVNHNKEEPLMCSYFLKTTVFWMTQVGSVEWCPNNLLNCFWKCFKYLIHCVYRGEFPNFFIPQNNMFTNKVVGAARMALLGQLYHYHNMGIYCLLLSPTLRSILQPVLSCLPFVIRFTDNDLDLDNTAYQEIVGTSIPSGELYHTLMLLSAVDKLLRLSLSPYQALALQYYTAEVLVHTAFGIISLLHNTRRNVYRIDRIACSMLKLAARIGPVCYALYLALYYYRTGRYNEALHITNLTKQRLSQPDSLLIGSIIDRQKYREAVGSLSLSRRMNTAWVCILGLMNETLYIDELILEQEVSSHSGQNYLSLVPWVLMNMILVLSHYRLGNRSQYLQSLTDLHTLLLYDYGRYIPLKARDLSWQILGICQHVVGDLHGALWSYQESLRQKPYHNIQRATENRIMLVERQLQRNRQS